MSYEFEGLKKDGDKTMVVFNKAGAPKVEVEVGDFAFSQFEKEKEIGYQQRIDAVIAIIDGNVDIPLRRTCRPFRTLG